MIKTLTNLLKQDKEKFVVPKGVQDCIPITAIYDVHFPCRQGQVFQKLQVHGY